mmetsp:Transcript_40520/g.46463  ORF Transcript_40520/g.46463 Transcript_40520/m.46463 type:complete len:961 (+) Transcript_40520:130-3012(+)
MTGSRKNSLHRSSTVDIVLHESRKTWVSKMFYRYPSVCVFLAFTFAGICCIISLPEMQLSEDSERTFLVWDDLRVERQDAYNEAIDKVEVGNQKKQSVAVQTEAITAWTVWVIYEAKKSVGSLLTPAVLNDMENLENQIANHKRYKNVCLIAYDTAADASICNVHRRSPVDTFPNHDTQTEIETTMTGIFADDDRYLSLKPSFEKGWSTSDRTPRWARTMIEHGAPLTLKGRTYNYYKEDEDAQDEYFVDYVLDVADIVDDYKSSNFDTYFFNQKWFDEKSNELVMQDFAFVGLSLAFVIFYMMVHTRSVVLPIIGMFQVILAFPVAFFFYRFVFQITFFNMMSLLSIFVILGIAADDIFVFMDAWKQSEQYACLADDLEKRVAYVYRRAAKAMFVTTITTFSAFLATAISDLAPISAFGIFSANLILANYFLVITLFPACVIVRHKILNRNKKQEPRKDSIPKETGSPKVYAGVPKENPQLDANKEADVEGNANSADVNVAVVATSPEAKVAQKPHLREESRVAVFLATKYFDKVTKARYFIMAFFAMWFIATLVMATQIEPLSENEKWVPSDSNVSEAFDAIQDTFHKGETDGFIKVNIVYGIDGLDRSDVRAYDVESIGDVEWDNNFDLSPKANQERMIEVCSLVKNSPLVQDQIIECFMADFKTWITNDGADSTAFPVEPSQFHTKMREYLKGPGYEHQAQNRVGYVGNRMRYAVIYTVAVGKMEVYEYMYPRWEDWEDFAEEINKNSPAGMNNAYQTSTMWQFMIAERALVRNAIQGMLIAGSISFVVLIMSTLNLVLAVYAITAIIGIVISVLAFAFMLGWEFGMVVAIAVVILIGFSVDYAVHICHAYVESQAETRAEKTRDALRKMGISILGGAITTFGTGAILFLTTLVFFQRFAWVISATIIFAVMWAMVFLPALLIICGPQGETGNLKVWYVKLKAKIATSRGKKNGNN